MGNQNLFHYFFSQNLFLSMDYFLIIKSFTCTKDCIRVWMTGNDINNLKWLYSVSFIFLIECLKNYGQKFMILYMRQWSRPSPRKRNAKKEKWLSEEALQIAERREAKGKGKKERYTHLNAEFQRITRRYKNKSSSGINARK